MLSVTYWKGAFFSIVVSSISNNIRTPNEHPDTPGVCTQLALEHPVDMQPAAEPQTVITISSDEDEEPIEVITRRRKRLFARFRRSDALRHARAARERAMAEEVIVVSSESEGVGPSTARTRIVKPRPRKIGCKNKHQVIITSDFSDDESEGMDYSDDEVTVVS